MLKLLSHILSQGMATQKSICPPLDEFCLGMPEIGDSPCSGTDCGSCQQICPTAAIKVSGQGPESQIGLDLGACIACGLCIEACPTGTIVSGKSTATAVKNRQELVLFNNLPHSMPAVRQPAKEIFRDSLSIRVVSTGCSACDLEIGAAGNPVFDMERFGVQVVASPRFADALVVTGPVGKGMQAALRRCYEAMPEPRKVIAAGTCAISGGVHRAGYAEANGVDSILPVDVYIPGCPPHPWSIIHGLMLTMGRTLL